MYFAQEKNENIIHEKLRVPTSVISLWPKIQYLFFKKKKKRWYSRVPGGFDFRRSAFDSFVIYYYTGSPTKQSVLTIIPVATTSVELRTP
jgi:hypothetical protein